MTASERVRRCVIFNRRSHGMSQADLAERMTAEGVPATNKTVSKIETGERNISIDELEVFAVIFGTPVHYLLGDTPIDARSFR